MRKALRNLALIACIVPMAAAYGQEGKRKKEKKESLHDQVSGQGYGLAGCGLGSIVFGPKPGMIQIVAATLNDTGVQTFGITTGTSNCDIPEMGQQAALFIELNQETLKKEVARGSGDTVESLALILKCQDHQRFGEKLRENFSSVMAEGTDSYEKTRRILTVIEADSALQTTCETLG